MVLTVVRAGPLTLVQDRGRTGLAHLGVPRAGPLDRPAAELANRLVGNGPDAALLEVTGGGLELVSDAGVWVAVTGAEVEVDVDGAGRGLHRAERLPAGSLLRLGAPVRGLRSFVAVAGGVDVPAVLGSRSTDTLAWVGPPRVLDGATLPVGVPQGPPEAVDAPRLPRPGRLRVRPGPRADWFGSDALRRLCQAAYVVGADSNRVGLRLEGPALERVRTEELPSEGVVLGAVQVPPNGQPVVFLADHPPTGGYPVLAVVHPDDLWQCGQARPGETLRFVTGA
ncbi:biotin-dependent carboxyltransferase family protein [Nocardioides anomalus]|uniref:Biotin-dependent carboxyltransferase family protein n=1 Tax=Nocardioides anomalus TaxID=2712223 RepID=A0A6G6WBE9_9ACTN|nr:biotin-dependent carboxyltransferase family protein [Nocardioides anomalus]QIG42671.1 biotin-dependent carboxyltransferase family protein [Nocardioides anomalus]